MHFRKSTIAAVLLLCPVVIHAAPAEAQDDASSGATNPKAAQLPPVVPPPPVLAGTLEQETAPEHVDLYNAMEEGVDESLVIENALAAMRRELAADANIAFLETQSPGLVEELANSVRPTFKEHTTRVREMYLPQMTDLFARYLTPAEAQDAADFYRSAIGRRMLKLLSSNYTIDAMLSDYEEGSAITQDEVNRDVTATVMNTLGELTAEELIEIEQTVTASPGLMKLNMMQGEIRALRMQMENEALSPTSEKAMEAAMTAVFERRFPQ